jgi:hypothetical protein
LIDALLRLPDIARIFIVPVARLSAPSKHLLYEHCSGNRHNKRLNRFTLRGRRKVNTQWQLYCLMHNIEKLMYYGNMKWEQ